MRAVWIGAVAGLVAVVFAVSCSSQQAGGTGEDVGDRRDARTCRAAVQYRYDAARNRCVEVSCGGGPDVETTYFSRGACRQAHGLGDTGPVDVPWPEDTTVTEDSGEESSPDAADTTTHRADTAEDGGAGDVGADTSSDTGPDAALTCSDKGLTSCFSNYDCASDERCENTRTSDNPLPCCVEGARGTRDAGKPCTDGGQTSCTSGVCISKSTSDEYYCSKRCQSDSDCPENMQDCTTVFGASDKWCFPTE